MSHSIAPRFQKSCQRATSSVISAELSLALFRIPLALFDRPEEERPALIADYKERFANPYTAAERGYVDDVIEPRRTRAVLIDALEASLTKREQIPKRKHGNIPL